MLNKKENILDHISRIIFLVLFFCSLNLFSNKINTGNYTQSPLENTIGFTVSQTKAIITQSGFDILNSKSVISHIKLFPFCVGAGWSNTQLVYIQDVSFFNTQLLFEKPDIFCRFFYFHHSSYSEEA